MSIVVRRKSAKAILDDSWVHLDGPVVEQVPKDRGSSWPMGEEILQIGVIRANRLVIAPMSTCCGG